MPRVVCAGHVNWDVSLYVDALPEPDGEARLQDRRAGGGGSAANVAAALTGLGVDAAVVGAVGDDDTGQRLRAELDEWGIDTAGLRTVEGSTSEKYLLVDEGGRVSVVGHDGVNEALGPDDVDAAWLRGADHLHLTGQRRDTAVALAELAADAGATVSLDPGRRVADRDRSGLAGLVDVVFVNRVESAAIDEATLGDGALVVTVGEDGASVTAGGTHHDHAGFSADAVDATGAGDAFAAGFIAARLDGAGFERALATGNACGAIATETRGARVSLDRERVESVLTDAA